MKTKINDKGYLVFPNENGPDKLVHRWKAEEKYGAEAIKGNEIHHIDKDKLNNNFDNLLLITKEDHFNLHQYENKKDFAYSSIIIFALGYFFFNILGNLLPINTLGLITIARLLILGILIITIELRYGFVSKAIKRPYSKMKE